MRRLRSSSSSEPAVAGEGAAGTSANTSTKRRRTDKRETLDVDVAMQMEQQQQENKDKLPDELWDKVLKSVDDNSVMAFALVCKQLRRVQQEAGRRLETELKGYEFFNFSSFYFKEEFMNYMQRLSTRSEDWFLWSMRVLPSPEEEKKRTRIMNAAAFLGHLNLLKQWKEQSRAKKSLFDEKTCEVAALGGQLEVLVLLRENNCPWNDFTCHLAALGGHLDVLKYAHEKGCPWDEDTCAAAACEGHLEVLKYAYEKGCPWDEYTCYYAAEGGHLEVLKYAHEKGCEWDELTCYHAAIEGHLDVLQYARENGCPWIEPEIREVAARHNRRNVLDYLVTLEESSSDHGVQSLLS